MTWHEPDILEHRKQAHRCTITIAARELGPWPSKFPSWNEFSSP